MWSDMMTANNKEKKKFRDRFDGESEGKRAERETTDTGSCAVVMMKEEERERRRRRLLFIERDRSLRLEERESEVARRGRDSSPICMIHTHFSGESL